MITRNIYIAIFFITCVVHSALEIEPISPYINKGISFSAQLSHNQLSIIHYYKKASDGNYYVAYANTVYFNQNWRNDNYMVIGGNKERLEISGWSTIFLPPWTGIKFRLKANIVNTDVNILFRNVAVSPFFGAALETHYYQLSYNDVSLSGKYKENFVLYSGLAIGTRKNIDDFSYFEVFTNPQVSFTRYEKLGGYLFAPSNFLSDPIGFDKEGDPIFSNNTNNMFYIKRYYFVAPIGVGLKYRNIALKIGVAISATLGKSRLKDTEQIQEERVVVNSYDFPKIPFFIECSIHFGRFRKMEKETRESEI